MKKITLLLLAMSLTFCTKNDNDAVDNPIDPVENTTLMKELTASPDGWKLTYVSPDDSFGGYNFLMKLPLPPAATALKKRGEA